MAIAEVHSFHTISPLAMPAGKKASGIVIPNAHCTC